MKPTSEILERIEKCSSEHKDGVFTRLYRYLLREDIYYAAYHNVGTCLWHVSVQTAIYLRIGNMPKACPYAMALSF